jgi:repressor LexA
MKEMTSKQREVYDFICDKIMHQGFPPTVREIGENFSISVLKGPYDHLKAIERRDTSVALPAIPGRSR